MRPQKTVWGMRIACRIPKATNTHSEYVTLFAFPLQQWLRERASMVPYSTLPVLLKLYNTKASVVEIPEIDRQVSLYV